MKKGILILITLLLVIILTILSFIGYVKHNEDVKEKENAKTEETETTEEFMATADAITLGNDLYEKVSTIAFDKTKYDGLTVESSTMEGYQNKIVGYLAVTSEFIKDPSIYVYHNEILDEKGDIYFNIEETTKNKSFVSTELQIKEIDYKMISFNAVTTYCYMATRACTAQELLTNYTKETRNFTLEKIDDKWKVSEFTLAY
jgi:hypothetical protein